MLACDKTVTLVKLDRDDQYSIQTIAGVSWYEKVKTAVQDKGMAYANEIKVRIPAERMPEGAAIEPKDVLVLGTMETVPQMPKDLQPYRRMTVAHVGDNRRGGLPHWAVFGT